MIPKEELYWCAGFLEGEGCFSGGGRQTGSAIIIAAQAQREPLERLKLFVGGSIRAAKKKQQPHHRDIFIWSMSGVKGAGFMMTLYSLMSPERKKKIMSVLKEWKQHPPGDKYKTHCVNGHEYNVANTRVYTNSRHGGKARDCRTCSRASDRARYASRREQACARQRNRRALARTLGLVSR